ncbi:hypothetical protein [Paenibacillus sp. UASWS1643]|uniref:hypothetical protein n=1 Tax=Paenibacillus sp. UASWS1643 TaxID=2580422 RepID=UPI00123BDEB4|nr:hypothetical protein [Paenibacillus sp. UASWS1643]KAA8756527.1 hypothetical protein FE296_03535 [Paenibacillus sp. UASWS1643]
MARECYSTFKAANEKDPLYQALEHGIELGVIVHEFEEGIPRYIQMVYDTGFDIRVTQPANLDFFSFGAHSDDILPILIAKVNAGVELSSAVEQAYAEIADASVGGMLLGFRFSNENLAHSNVWINDKTAYPTWKGNRLPCLADMQGNAIMNKLTANSAQINSSDFNNGAIVGSSINVGNGKFKVDTAGNMYAEGSTTVGGTITGSLIRTAASGRRVEINASGFRSYDANGATRVQILTSDDSSAAAIVLRDASGTSVGELNSYANNGTLTMYGNSIVIGSNNTANPIRLQGAVTFGGAVNFPNGISLGQVNGLQSQLDSIWSAINGKSVRGHTHQVTTSNHNHGNSANLPGTGGGTFTTTSD